MKITQGEARNKCLEQPVGLLHLALLTPVCVLAEERRPVPNPRAVQWLASDPAGYPPFLSG